MCQLQPILHKQRSSNYLRNNTGKKLKLKFIRLTINLASFHDLDVGENLFNFPFHLLSPPVFSYLLNCARALYYMKYYTPHPFPSLLTIASSGEGVMQAIKLGVGGLKCLPETRAFQEPYAVPFLISKP